MPLNWDEALEHLTAGRFSLDGFVTHRFALEDIEAAFAIRAHDLEHSLKVVVTNA